MHRLRLLAWIVVVGASIGCSQDQGEGGAGARPSPTGTLRLEATSASALGIDHMSYTIEVPNQPSLMGTVPIGEDGELPLIAAVPASDGVTISLSASGPGDITCFGKAVVSVVAGETVRLSIPLECHEESGEGGAIEVHAKFNICPQLKASADGAAGSFAVSAAAQDQDGGDLSYAWTAGSGRFQDAGAASTTYACTESGPQVLSVKVTDADGCSIARDVEVTCVQAAPGGGSCGDGTLDAGEECDHGNTSSGDGCSDACRRESAPAPVCGDGTLDAGEECDDGNTSSGDGCSATCVSEMEAPVSALCSAESTEMCAQCTCGQCADQVTACNQLEGEAQAGPGAGKPKAELCQALLACGQENGCLGDVCLLLDTPCVKAYCAAAELDCTDLQSVNSGQSGQLAVTLQERSTDRSYALGAASAVSKCINQSCLASCPNFAPHRRN